MEFFRIRNSLDTKVAGEYPQIKDIKYTSTVYDNLKFINTVRFTKIEFEPEVPTPILESKVNRTDLIEDIPTTPFNILISEKLKTILKTYRKDGVQFFRGSVLQNGIEYSDYWFLNMYIINNEYIDYNNCAVMYRKKKKEEYGTIPISMNFENEADFNIEKEKAKINLEAFYIEKLVLHGVKEDFFMLRDIEGGAGFFVSEKLKKEIEDAGCTGIEFQPSELSYNEWVAPGGDREKVYGKSW